MNKKESLARAKCAKYFGKRVSKLKNWLILAKKTPAVRYMSLIITLLWGPPPLSALWSPALRHFRYNVGNMYIMYGMVTLPYVEEEYFRSRSVYLKKTSIVSSYMLMMTFQSLLLLFGTYNVRGLSTVSYTHLTLPTKA